jgi:hypothetical protein
MHGRALVKLVESGIYPGHDPDRIAIEPEIPCTAHEIEVYLPIEIKGKSRKYEAYGDGQGSIDEVGSCYFVDENVFIDFGECGARREGQLVRSHDLKSALGAYGKNAPANGAQGANE